MPSGELQGRWNPKLHLFQRAKPGGDWVPCSAVPDAELSVPVAGAPVAGKPAAKAPVCLVHYALPFTHQPLLACFTVERKGGALPAVPDYSPWSTDDDSNPKNSGRTYQLNSLMEQIGRIRPPQQATPAGTLLYLQ